MAANSLRGIDILRCCKQQSDKSKGRSREIGICRVEGGKEVVEVDTPFFAVGKNEEVDSMCDGFVGKEKVKRFVDG